MTLTADSAPATELLGLAVNRLYKSCAPDPHNAAPKAEISTEETQKAKADEEHAQAEYVAFISESAASRADKVKELEKLQNTKASMSASMTGSKEDAASAVTSAARTARVSSSLYQAYLVRVCPLSNITFSRSF